MADNILLIDKFVVINHTLLNDTDRLSLTLLYQPIVGSIAISLYFTLWSFTLDDDLTHYDIVSNMQVKLEDICIAKEKHCKRILKSGIGPCITCNNLS